MQRLSIYKIGQVSGQARARLDSWDAMHTAFRVHFRDRFARCFDFPVQKFRSC